MKITQADGTELEVFSQEEADALAATKAEEAAQAERERLEAEHQSKLLEAEEAKAELEKKLKGYADKEFNFNQLRNKKEKGDEESKKLSEALKEVHERIAKVESQPFEKMKNDFIEANGISADKELSDKFDYFFKPLQGQAKTEADLKAALTGAYAAATGGAKQPSFEGMMVSTRVSPTGSKEGQVSKASLEIATSLGLTEEDRKNSKHVMRFGHAKK